MSDDEASKLEGSAGEDPSTSPAATDPALDDDVTATQPALTDDDAPLGAGSGDLPPASGAPAEDEGGGWETWHGGAVKPDQGT